MPPKTANVIEVPVGKPTLPFAKKGFLAANGKGGTVTTECPHPMKGLPETNSKPTTTSTGSQSWKGAPITAVSYEGASYKTTSIGTFQSIEEFPTCRLYISRKADYRPSWERQHKIAEAQDDNKIFAMLTYLLPTETLPDFLQSIIDDSCPLFANVDAIHISPKKRHVGIQLWTIFGAQNDILTAHRQFHELLEKLIGNIDKDSILIRYAKDAMLRSLALGDDISCADVRAVGASNGKITKALAKRQGKGGKKTKKGRDMTAELFSGIDAIPTTTDELADVKATMAAEAEVRKERREKKQLSSWDNNPREGDRSVQPEYQGGNRSFDPYAADWRGGTANQPLDARVQCGFVERRDTKGSDLHGVRIKKFDAPVRQTGTLKIARSGKTGFVEPDESPGVRIFTLPSAGSWLWSDAINAGIGGMRVSFTVCANPRGGVMTKDLWS